MAAAPDDRYAAVGEMVLAIEAYLDESGLPPDKIPAELARYFQAPASYEEALKARLIDTLTRTGTTKLDGDDRSGALDVFDRVLTIDPENEKVLAILDRLNRRARVKTGLLVAAGLGVLVFGGYEIHMRSLGPPAGVPNINVPSQGSAIEHNQHVVHELRPPDAAIVDARSEVALVPHDGPRMVTVGIPDAMQVVTAQPDAAITLEPIQVAIKAVPGSTYRLDASSAYSPIPAGGLVVTYTDHPLKVSIINPCCQEVTASVDGTTKSLDVRASQRFLPGYVTASCAVADVSVSIDGKTATLGEPLGISFAESLQSSRNVKVTFTGKTIDIQSVNVAAGKTTEVKCALH